MKVEHENLTDDFSRLGVNLIVDKIWFVDLTAGEAHYSYENIGYAEGEAIARGETKMVIESVLTKANVEENSVECLRELNEKGLKSAISLLGNRGFECDSILTNVNEVMLFWLDFESFVGVGYGSTNPYGVEGHYEKIPVYWSNLMPKGMTLVTSKEGGELLVKKEITADILKIREDEVESILESVSGLDREKLKEKVRLIADEVVSFRFKRKEAFIIVKSLGKSDLR